MMPKASGVAAASGVLLLGLVSATAAMAQGAPLSKPWTIDQDYAYTYGADGKTTAYKLGTSNAGTLLIGAKKVPKNTIFFFGQNGQLYMKTGPFLDGEKFKFGPG